MANITGITNNCTNCGGDLEYDLATNSSKCAYCGSAFKTEPTAAHVSSTEVDAGCIPFRRDFSKFKEAVISFLASGDRTPPNLLFEAVFQPAKQLYIPYYQFSGTYEGYYNTFDQRDKAVSQNTPLTGNFSVTTYGGCDEVDHKQMEAFVGIVDQKLMVPISNIVLTGITLADSLAAKVTWESKGQLEAAGQVYRQLDKTDPGHRHEHYLKYHTQSAGKFYYPVWRVVYSYLGDEYAIYMDDLSGELNGGKPIDLQLVAPARTAVYKKYLLVGLGLWFGVLVIRAALTAFVGDSFEVKDHVMDNILFSEPGGLYWLLRGAIFLGVFPLLMVSVFYGSLVRAYYAKVAQLRIGNVKLIASGRNGIAFTQANL